MSETANTRAKTLTAMQCQILLGVEYAAIIQNQTIGMVPLAADGVTESWLTLKPVASDERAA